MRLPLVRRWLLGLTWGVAAFLVTGGASRTADRPATPLPQPVPHPRAVVVASKPFGESYLLAELFAQLLEAHGYTVVRRPGLGATQVAFAALRSGAIDVYPEYTGTGLVAVLHDSTPTRNARDAFARVARGFADRYDAHWLPPLGFENRYALAVRRETAQRYGLRTISDLARAAPQLRGAFSPDFLGRADGLPGLTHAYGLHLAAVQPLAPALKYQALAAGAVDVVDGYSTDALIARYGLVVLDDDRHFFPPYEAAPLASGRFVRELPGAAFTLTELAGRLDEATMRRLNARIEIDGVPVARVAGDALVALGIRAPGQVRATVIADPAGRGVLAYLWADRAGVARRTGQHLTLTLGALLAACGLGIPLGLWLERRRRGAAEAVVRATGVLQTVPGIALLAFMVPVLGIGRTPALAALFLYGLYPIVRGTYAGVRDAAPGAVAAATALGMTPGQVLRQVRLPLAAPAILGGVRTAAVIGIGTATLAAFIGAGGLGETIVSGLALADMRLVLAGAIPAALLALFVDAALAGVERLVTPPSQT